MRILRSELIGSFLAICGAGVCLAQDTFGVDVVPLMPNANPVSLIDPRQSTAYNDTLAKFQPNQVALIESHRSTILPQGGCALIGLYADLSARYQQAISAQAPWSTDPSNPDSAWLNKLQGFAPFCADGALPAEAFAYPADTVKFNDYRLEADGTQPDEGRAYIVFTDIEHSRPTTERDSEDTAVAKLGIVYHQGTTSDDEKILIGKLMDHWMVNGANIRTTNPYHYWPSDEIWQIPVREWFEGVWVQ